MTTTTPRRIQRRRTRGWRMPEGCVSVTRPGKWGNPYRVGAPIAQVLTGEPGDLTAEQAVKMYRLHLDLRPDLVAAARAALAGKDLACWCREGDPCHGDVLLEVANGAAP